jgi:hypothetical protein
MTMREVVDILETRVAAAAGLIAALREKTAGLERDLAAATAHECAAEAPPPCDPAVLRELERLRAERAEIRERIRGLIREIDRVSW